MFHFQSPERKRILLVLTAICLSLWAVALIEHSNARYLTRRTGEVSVRVASFLVEVNDPVLKSPDAVIDCNLEDDRVQYGLMIRNRSEVDVTYEVAVTGLPTSVHLDTERETGTLSANGEETEVILSFSCRDRTDRRQSSSIAGCTVTVYAVQKGDGNE